MKRIVVFGGYGRPDHPPELPSGVHHVEEILDPAAFLDELSAYGFAWGFYDAQ